MGTKMAPAHPTINLEYLEETQYEIIDKMQQYKKRIYLTIEKYLDDCFIFWKFPGRNNLF